MSNSSPNKASVAIFYKSIDYPESVSQPFVPDDIFIAAKRVIENKTTEIVQTRSGVFVVSASDTGPFNSELPKGWLPVRILRLKQWHSGGIQKEEYESFLANRKEKETFHEPKI